RGRRTDGRFAVMEISSSATVFDGVPAVVSYGRDVTERKELFARIVQQDRLAAIGMVAAGLAHEINSPLAYLAMHLRRALGEFDAAASDPSAIERARALVVDALEGTEGISAIAHELLSLARDERVSRAGVDVATVVRSATKFALTASDARVDVQFE